MLQDVHQRLKVMGTTLEVTEKFKDKLLDEGWNPTYGARPLRRAINNLLEDPLSECLLKANVEEGDTIEVDVNSEGKIVIMGNGGVVVHEMDAPLVPAGVA